ncbi:MAG: nucleotidyltransferase family protein [Caldilineaceae bacterium]|nr:nucleotidyltransferase family protein [Caldilineaceae bacterium]MXZ25546.1 nucleotidyltransferase family protein [Caldilineaceae bacterium SB0665_bin_21]
MTTVSPVGTCGFAVLAAGSGSRFGGAKQVAVLGGRTMVEHAIAIADRARRPPSPIVVVTGAHQAEVERTVVPLLGNYSGLSMCHNPDWSLGMSTSLRTGIDHLERTASDVEAVLFMLSDQPLVSPDLLCSLQQRWHQGWTMAAPVHEGKLLGAPALFGRVWWPCIRNLQGDRGARGILETHQDEVGGVETDPGQLADIDARQDLRHHTGAFIPGDCAPRHGSDRTHAAE